MGKKHIQTRVPEELGNQIEEYQESKEFMNDSEAIRELLRTGLEAKGYHDTTTDPDGGTDTTSILERIGSARTLGAGTVFTLLSVLPMFGAEFAVSNGDIALALVASTLAVLLMGVACVIIAAAALAQIALALPLHQAVYPLGETA